MKRITIVTKVMSSNEINEQYGMNSNENNTGNDTDDDGKGTMFLDSVRNKNNFIANHRNMDNSNLETDYNNQNREINYYYPYFDD